MKDATWGLKQQLPAMYLLLFQEKETLENCPTKRQRLLENNFGS